MVTIMNFTNFTSDDAFGNVGNQGTYLCMIKQRIIGNNSE